MREPTKTNLLQDISALLASLLPIAQLFFARLPDAVTGIFLAEKSFLGVSLITLLIGYVFIVAYQIKPWFSISLPFQGKRTEKYQVYLDKVGQANELRKELAVKEHLSEKDIKRLANILEKNVQKPPVAFSNDNLLFVLVLAVSGSSILFVGLGLGNHQGWWPVVQAVSYVIMITCSALILSVFRRVSENDKDWSFVRTSRDQAAIQLATINNCFGDTPQVKYISSFEDSSTFPLRYHVWVEYKNQKYEIITDNRGEYLFAVYPFK